jgi:ribosomal protein S18 acetylase RimI-like enzyme
MSPRIRRAGITDAPAVAEIYVETWREAYPGMLPDRVLLGMSREHQRRAWRQSICDAAQSVLLAAEGSGSIVGFGSCGPTRHPSVPFTGEIYTLYVAPDHQRRGVGSLLLTALLRDLSRRGHRSALVWALADNPSRFFYEAMGGTLVAESTELMWGRRLRQRGYGWRDLEDWLATRTPQQG